MRNSSLPSRATVCPSAPLRWPATKSANFPGAFPSLCSPHLHASHAFSTTSNHTALLLSHCCWAYSLCLLLTELLDQADACRY